MKSVKAKAITKLLKQGCSPREVTQRMDASYNYAWKLQKDLAEEKAAAAKTVRSERRAPDSLPHATRQALHRSPHL